MALAGEPETAPQPTGDLRVDPVARTRFGRLLGALYVIGGLSSIPSSLLVEPPPTPLIVPVTAFAILGGVAWMAFPWVKAGPGWMHAAVAAGTVAVGLANAAAGPTYAFYGVLVAVFAAYAFRSRAAIAAHLGLLIGALVVAIPFSPASTREVLQVEALAIPNVIIAAVLVAFLRERSEHRERSLHDFAEEAMALTGRIRTSHRSRA